MYRNNQMVNFFKVTGFEAKNKNLLVSSLLFLFGAIFILCSFVVN